MFKNEWLNSGQVDYIKKHYPHNAEDILHRFAIYTVTWGKKRFTDDEVKTLSRKADITIRIDECSKLFTFTDFRKKVLNIGDDAWLFMVLRDAVLARVPLEAYKQYLDAAADALRLIKREWWNATRMREAWNEIEKRQNEYATFIEIIEEVERTS